MQAMIRDAAMKLFTTEGVESVSMRKIADAIEYTPGALYSYYEDKDEILYALHVEGFDKLHALQKTIEPHLPPMARLRRCGETYLQFALANPELYDLMFVSRSIMCQIESSRSWEQGMHTYDTLRRIVRDCMASGDLPMSELESATFAMWSLVHGAAALVIRGRCPVMPETPPADLVKYAFEFMMRAVTRGPTGS